MSRRDRGAALPGDRRAGRAGGRCRWRPLVLGRLPGAGLGFAKPLGLLLVTWLVWIGGSARRRPVRHGLGDRGDRRRWPAPAWPARWRCGAGRRAAALVARAAPGARAARARPVPAVAADRRRGRLRRRRSARWRCSSPTRPTSGTPRSRWTWRFVNALNQRRSFPPHDPWMAGDDAQLLLPRPPGDGDARCALARRRARAAATTSRSRCCSRSPRRRCSRSPARCGRRARGARRACARGGR